MSSPSFVFSLARAAVVSPFLAAVRRLCICSPRWFLLTVVSLSVYKAFHLFLSNAIITALLAQSGLCFSASADGCATTDHISSSPETDSKQIRDTCTDEVGSGAVTDSGLRKVYRRSESQPERTKSARVKMRRLQKTPPSPSHELVTVSLSLDSHGKLEPRTALATGAPFRLHLSRRRLLRYSLLFDFHFKVTDEVEKNGTSNEDCKKGGCVCNLSSPTCPSSCCSSSALVSSSYLELWHACAGPLTSLPIRNLA